MTNRPKDPGWHAEGGTSLNWTPGHQNRTAGTPVPSIIQTFANPIRVQRARGWRKRIVHSHARSPWRKRRAFRELITVRILTSVVALALAFTAGFNVLTAGAQSATDGVADAAGNLRVPSNYKVEYQYLGTWAVAADNGAGSKELHVVYASPGAMAAFKANGHFPNRTVLIRKSFKQRPLR